VPADAEAATQARAIGRVFDLYYYAAQRPIGSAYFGGDETDEAIANARDIEMPKAFRYIEKYIGDGKWAVGDAPTIADAALISQLYWYDRVAEKYDLPGFGDCKRLAAYWARAKETELAQRSFARVAKSFDEFFGGKK
jgi:glutathione S-transferase